MNDMNWRWCSIGLYLIPQPNINGLYISQYHSTYLKTTSAALALDDASHTIFPFSAHPIRWVCCASVPAFAWVLRHRRALTHILRREWSSTVRRPHAIRTAGRTDWSNRTASPRSSIHAPGGIKLHSLDAFSPRSELAPATNLSLLLAYLNPGALFCSVLF